MNQSSYISKGAELADDLSRLIKMSGKSLKVWKMSWRRLELTICVFLTNRLSERFNDSLNNSLDITYCSHPTCRKCRWTLQWMNLFSIMILKNWVIGMNQNPSTLYWTSVALPCSYITKREAVSCYLERWPQYEQCQWHRMTNRMTCFYPGDKEMTTCQRSKADMIH